MFNVSDEMSCFKLGYALRRNLAQPFTDRDTSCHCIDYIRPKDICRVTSRFPLTDDFISHSENLAVALQFHSKQFLVGNRTLNGSFAIVIQSNGLRVTYHKSWCGQGERRINTPVVT